MTKKLSIILFLLLSCNQSQKKINQNNLKMNNNKHTFFLNYDLRGQYKIYCNGINLVYNQDTGSHSGYEYLNPIIHKKGIQTISMSFKPHSEIQIYPRDIENIFLEIFFSENQENPPFKMIKRLKFPSIEKPVDSLFYTWDFEADVNYELPNVLENATNLTKEDPNRLLEEVVSFYTTIYDILNNGEMEKYRNIFQESLTRQAKSMYYNEQEIQKYITEQVERAGKAKGSMQPMKDYNIEIGLNNKTVELIQETGKSPLISIDKEEYIRVFGFTLFRNKATGKLEVY